jgi:hypothetical protein
MGTPLGHTRMVCLRTVALDGAYHVNKRVFQNYIQTNLGLRNITLGKHIHVQHTNIRTLPVEGSAHDNGRTMVCAEYVNTEGSPNPNG